ncbi:MAG: alpha/beta fold hydrolase [Sphingomonadales bacterium]|nr:alpha/beta fold hydrolase [Sphingomonadales bacterium]MBU3993278.1 alpha/beta fold hydrolase [Alphaproteobacteria bacterium]
MATFILIHGAFHGGWCWERIVPLLAAKGHEVIAPDLPGMGRDTTPFADDTLTQWAEFTAGLVRRAQGPVILAGHSQGGAVVAQAAELVPEQIAHLAFVAALVMENGGTLLRGRDLETLEEGSHGMLILSADKRQMRVDPDKAKAAFCSRMTPGDAQAAAERMTPQPISLMKTPLRLTPERFGTVPRAYLEAADDLALSLAYQREMQRNWPCDPVITLDSDHSPFYSAPEALAEALLSLLQPRLSLA